MLKYVRMKVAASVKARRGFTLIEILIVIAIIATLASVAYPIFTSYMQDARAMASRKDCMDIANAIENFKRDNNSMWPLHTDDIDDSQDVITLVTEPGKDGGLLEILTSREKGDMRVNERRYVYLRGDLNEDPRGGIYEDAGGGLGYYDPWGKPYTVLITDLEGDGLPDPFTGKDTRKQVLVYGNGPDGKASPIQHEKKKRHKRTVKGKKGAKAAQEVSSSADDPNEDNVYSWKKLKN